MPRVRTLTTQQPYEGASSIGQHPHTGEPLYAMRPSKRGETTPEPMGLAKYRVPMGKLFKIAIRHVTGREPGPSCKCNARARQMNEWGLWGCVRNRQQIIQWLTDEANKRGHEIDRPSTRAILTAAWKEWRKPQ